MDNDQINEVFRSLGRIEQKQDHTLDLLRVHSRRIGKVERRVGKIMLLATAVGTPLIWFGKKMAGLL